MREGFSSNRDEIRKFSRVIDPQTLPQSLNFPSTAATIMPEYDLELSNNDGEVQAIQQQVPPILSATKLMLPF